jgi:glucose-1-phosphate cytidylyltransferase
MSKLTAVLLAGGKGERLKPFTETLPKPLVPLSGRPLLYHLMKYLALHGVDDFVVCTGYKAEAIDAFLKEQAEPSWKYRCVNSGDVSMTDRLVDAFHHVTEDALICYGDTLANVDIRALRAFHGAHTAVVAQTVYPLHSPFGIVTIDPTDHITAFVEKPQLPYWINMGFMYCAPGVRQFLKPRSDMIPFLSELSQARQLVAYRHTGKHLTVNTEKDRAVAETEMVNFFTVLDG